MSVELRWSLKLRGPQFPKMILASKRFLVRLFLAKICQFFLTISLGTLGPRKLVCNEIKGQFPVFEVRLSGRFK